MRQASEPAEKQRTVVAGGEELGVRMYLKSYKSQPVVTCQAAAGEMLLLRKAMWMGMFAGGGVAKVDVRQAAAGEMLLLGKAMWTGMFAGGGVAKVDVLQVVAGAVLLLDKAL
ncbi:hypothetical protein BSKO_02826 [Bryopsis sp. KO-2023]|nr:hypothetical protein BSKO_02826 [Bryopsis sp. KO-2023]